MPVVKADPHAAEILLASSSNDPSGTLTKYLPSPARAGRTRIVAAGGGESQ